MGVGLVEYNCVNKIDRYLIYEKYLLFHLYTLNTISSIFRLGVDVYLILLAFAVCRNDSDSCYVTYAEYVFQES